MIKANKNYLVVLLLLYIIIKPFFVSTFSKGNQDTHTIDSVKVRKIIPEKTGSFHSEKIQPIIIYPPSLNNRSNNSNETNKILELFSSLQTGQTNLEQEQLQLKKLMEIIAKKEYKEIFEDSIVKIDVHTVVENGEKKSLSLNWKVKQSYIDYFEKTHTYKLYPKFTLSAGVGFDTKLDDLKQTNLKAILGIKNKKGFDLQFSIAPKNRYGISLKKDLFTKF